MGQLEGGHKKKDKDRSMQNIVQIYKAFVRPEQKGLTVSDFRKMFDAREGPMRKSADKRVPHCFPTGWSAEICEDMFRVLDKDKDGYVMLDDFLRFYAPKQLSKIPKWTFTKKHNKKIINTVLDKLPTPHLPEADQKELQEVFHLWVADAESSDGTLTRDEVMDILAGRKGAAFNWLEAREAADRMFEGVTYDTITFAEFANHLQDVMTVPYNHLMSGEVKRFKVHRRPRDAVGTAASKLKLKGKRLAGEHSPPGKGSLPSVGERGMTDGLGKGGRLEPLAVSFDVHEARKDPSLPQAPRIGGQKPSPMNKAASMRITRREQAFDGDDSPKASKDMVMDERGPSLPLAGDLELGGASGSGDWSESKTPTGGRLKPLNRAHTVARLHDLEEDPVRVPDLTPLKPLPEELIRKPSDSSSPMDTPKTDTPTTPKTETPEAETPET